MRRNAAIVFLLTFVVVIKILFNIGEINHLLHKTLVYGVTKRLNQYLSSKAAIKYDNTVIIRKPVFVKVKGARMYMKTATMDHSNKQLPDKTILTDAPLKNKQSEPEKTFEIVVSGWYIGHTSTDVVKENVTCCLKRSDGTLEATLVTEVKKAFSGSIKTIEGLRYVCSTRQPNTTHVSLAYMPGNCDYNLTYYIPVEQTITDQSGSLALCAKILYGNMEAERLVEWFEAQVYLGIDKVFVYLHANLNKRARKVFEYFSNIGVVEAFSFVVPENDTFPRFPQDKNLFVWTDEQVAIYGCQERMNAYTYGIFQDSDEIVLPETIYLRNSLKRYLIQKFASLLTTGSLTFLTKIHTTSQNFSSEPDDMFLARHLYSTGAFSDRPKNAIKMDRILPGSCSAHLCPGRSGFRRETVDPKEASLHHFRSCRKEWLKEEHGSLERKLNLLDKNTSGTVCSRFKMTKSAVVESLANAIRSKVAQTLSRLSLE